VSENVTPVPLHRRIFRQITYIVPAHYKLRKNTQNLRCKVLTTINVNNIIFLDVTQRSLVQVYRRFGRAVAEAVILWLSTVAARVRVRAGCGVCGGQSGTGAGFLRVLRFPLPIIIPSIYPA
jgi:hypothetical protein